VGGETVTNPCPGKDREPVRPLRQGGVEEHGGHVVACWLIPYVDWQTTVHNRQDTGRVVRLRILELCERRIDRMPAVADDPFTHTKILPVQEMRPARAQTDTSSTQGLRAGPPQFGTNR